MCHRMVSRPRKWQGQSVDCADEAIPHRVVESKRFGGPFVERLADWANVRSGRLILVNTPAAFIEAAQQEPVLTISGSVIRTDRGAVRSRAVGTIATFKYAIEYQSVLSDGRTLRWRQPLSSRHGSDSGLSDEVERDMNFGRVVKTLAVGLDYFKRELPNATTTFGQYFPPRMFRHPAYRDMKPFPVFPEVPTTDVNSTLVRGLELVGTSLRPALGSTLARGLELIGTSLRKRLAAPSLRLAPAPSLRLAAAPPRRLR